MTVLIRLIPAPASSRNLPLLGVSEILALICCSIPTVVLILGSSRFLELSLLGSHHALSSEIVVFFRIVDLENFVQSFNTSYISNSYVEIQARYLISEMPEVLPILTHYWLAYWTLNCDRFVYSFHL